MKKKLVLLFVLNLCLFFSLIAQVNDVTNPCDCINLAIKNHQLVQDGHSDYDANKILENQNIIKSVWIDIMLTMTQMMMAL